jgi:hypothetical protein
VPISLRRSLAPFGLVALTALILGLSLPVSATATQERPNEAETTTRAQERATREATREEERASRRAARAQERASREEQRASRKAARARERSKREEERASRRQTGHNSTSKGPAQVAGSPSGAGAGSPGESSANPPPAESGAHTGRNAPSSCHLTIEATSRRITAGEPVTLVGKLLCPSGTSAANQPVTVYQGQPGGGASDRSIAGTANTDAEGSYRLVPAAFDTNSVFFVRSLQAHGAHTIVKVAPAITLGGPAAVAQLSTVGGDAHVHALSRATFTGTVSPADAGAQVTLQLEYTAIGEHWRPVAFARVGPSGSYSITHGFRTPGEVSIRVVVHPAGHNNVPAASEPLTYEISQAQNPHLTIQASADPIPYGQAVTLSGVAVGASDQPVTLLARTQGNAFSKVATSTTDNSGNYSFGQSPRQNTYYMVTEATTRSRVLFEGVKYSLSAGPEPSSAAAGQQLTFSGTLAPAHAGDVAQLERQDGSGIGFYVVGVATVNADSTYSIAYSVPSVGPCIVRLRVPGNGENQGATSEPFTIGVTLSPALPLGDELASPLSGEAQT